MLQIRKQADSQKLSITIVFVPPCRKQIQVMTPKKILVATDFSSAGELAVQRAATLAQRYRAELRLLHAVPPQRWLDGLLPSRQHWTQQVSARASVALKALADQLATDRKIDVSTALIRGRASVAIASGMEQFKPDLVVIGAVGERLLDAQTGLGNTAMQLLRTTETPALLVRRHDIELPTRMLAALDLTPASVAVMRWARLLAARGGVLTALHVFDAPFADRLRGYGVSRRTIDVYARDQQLERERLLRSTLLEAGAGRQTNKLVLRGEAIRSITAQLRKLKIDTLVIGKHSRRKRDAAAPYGSVCQHLAYFAPVDVLIVP